MGFFQSLKDDFSEAVNGLIDGEEDFEQEEEYDPEEDMEAGEDSESEEEYDTEEGMESEEEYDTEEDMESEEEYSSKEGMEEEFESEEQPEDEEEESRPGQEGTQMDSFNLEEMLRNMERAEQEKSLSDTREIGRRVEEEAGTEEEDRISDIDLIKMLEALDEIKPADFDEASGAGASAQILGEDGAGKSASSVADAEQEPYDPLKDLEKMAEELAPEISQSGESKDDIPATGEGLSGNEDPAALLAGISEDFAEEEKQEPAVEEAEEEISQSGVSGEDNPATGEELSGDEDPAALLAGISEDVAEEVQEPAVEEELQESAVLEAQEAVTNTEPYSLNEEGELSEEKSEEEFEAMLEAELAAYDAKAAEQAQEEAEEEQSSGLDEAQSDLIRQAEAMAAAAVSGKRMKKKKKASPEKKEPVGKAEGEEALKPKDTKAKSKTKDSIKSRKENRKPAAVDVRDFSKETALIIRGMEICGDVESNGGMDVYGRVDGNVTIAGKLNVSGLITGDITAAEMYADGAEINGNVSCNGSVKVGQSTVIIGNINAACAVIAGAVKGNIDVHGPVILDSEAVVLGDIRSQSVQIGVGAAIEGKCSQVYAKVSPSAFFEEFQKGAAKNKEGEE